MTDIEMNTQDIAFGQWKIDAYDGDDLIYTRYIWAEPDALGIAVSDVLLTVLRNVAVSKVVVNLYRE